MVITFMEKRTKKITDVTVMDHTDELEFKSR